MNRIKIFLCIVFLSCTYVVTAQRVQSREGDVAMLKEVRRMNVQFVYEGMTISAKRVAEDEYVRDNVDRLNEKRRGKGDHWEEAWRNDRSQKFEPEFEAAFEQVSGIHLGNIPGAQYTLVFKTTHMETGYNIRIKRKSSFIDGEAWIVATADPEHILARITVKECKGRAYDGYDFAANLRLMESYATAGEMVGRFVAGEQ